MCLISIDLMHQFSVTVAQVLDSRQNRPYFQGALTNTKNRVGGARLSEYLHSLVVTLHLSETL